MFNDLSIDEPNLFDLFSSKTSPKMPWLLNLGLDENLLNLERGANDIFSRSKL